MPNPIGVGRRVDDQQSGVDRGANRGFSRRLVELDHRRQELRIRVAADGGQRRKHVTAGGVEARDVGFEELREEGGNGLTGEVRSDELLGEERVALARRTSSSTSDGGGGMPNTAAACTATALRSSPASVTARRRSLG